MRCMYTSGSVVNIVHVVIPVIQLSILKIIQCSWNILHWRHAKLIFGGIVRVRQMYIYFPQFTMFTKIHCYTSHTTVNFENNSMFLKYLTLEACKADIWWDCQSQINVHLFPSVHHVHQNPLTDKQLVRHNGRFFKRQVTHGVYLPNHRYLS